MLKYYRLLKLYKNGETKCAICGAWCQGFTAPDGKSFAITVIKILVINILCTKGRVFIHSAFYLLYYLLKYSHFPNPKQSLCKF